MNRASGLADLHPWELETQVVPVLGLFFFSVVLCQGSQVCPPPNITIMLSSYRWETDDST